MRRRPGLPQWVDDRLRHLVYSSVAPPQPPAAGSRRTGGCRRSQLPGYCGGDLKGNSPMGWGGAGGYVGGDLFGGGCFAAPRLSAALFSSPVFSSALLSAAFFI